VKIAITDLGLMTAKTVSMVRIFLVVNFATTALAVLIVMTSNIAKIAAIVRTPISYVTV